MTSTLNSKTFQVLFNNSSVITPADVRKIFKKCRPYLIREVFIHPTSNKFISILSEFAFETFEIQEFDNKPPSEWARDFIFLCENRSEPIICLNILVNLHKHELGNYHNKIVNYLNTIPNVEVKEVEEPAANESSPCLAETSSSNSSDKLANKMGNQRSVISFFVLSFMMLLIVCGIAFADKTLQPNVSQPSSRVAAISSGFEGNTSGNQSISEINDSNLKSSPTDLSNNQLPIPTTRDPQTTTKINAAVQTKGLNQEATNVPAQQVNATIQQNDDAAKNISKIGDEKQQRVFIQRPGEIGNKTTLLCDPDFKTELVIDAVDPFEWANVHVDCATRMHSLVIKGHLRPFDMLYIVNQTRNIKHLTINGNDLCTSFHGFLAFIDVLPRITLGRIRTLELRGMTDKESGCREVLTLIANKFRFSPKFKTLILNDVTIDTKNKVELHRVAYVIRYYVKDLLMNNIDFRTSAFDLNFPVLNLTSFHLFAKNSSSDLASHSVKNLLSNQHLIKEFHSNIEIPEDNMKLTLNSLKRIGVSNLKLSIGLLNTRNELSIRFIRGFRLLIHCEIQLVSRDRLDEPFTLRDVNSLRSSLQEFRVTANFSFKVVDGYVRCRGFDKNTKDGITTLTMDKCPNCVESGCSRR